MKVAVVLRTVLKGIPPILSPELLAVLARMGHADEIVIADANFPSASVAKNSILIRADGMVRPESMRGVAGSLTPIAGHSAIPILKAIAQLLPLDKYVPTPVRGLCLPSAVRTSRLCADHLCRAGLCHEEGAVGQGPARTHPQRLPEDCLCGARLICEALVPPHGLMSVLPGALGGNRAVPVLRAGQDGLCGGGHGVGADFLCHT